MAKQKEKKTHTIQVRITESEEKKIKEQFEKEKEKYKNVSDMIIRKIIDKDFKIQLYRPFRENQELARQISAIKRNLEQIANHAEDKEKIEELIAIMMKIGLSVSFHFSELQPQGGHEKLISDAMKYFEAEEL